jgi:hypothetical protein
MLGWWISVASAGEGALWTTLVLQSQLHEPDRPGLRLWLDVQGRRDAERFIGIVRPALGFDLSRHTSVYAGYAWIGTGTDGEGLAHEHRLWQQLLWTWARAPASLALRPRLEQRFSPDVQGVGLRVRLFARGQLDLREPFALVLWEEAFIGLGDVFLPAGFDQNRLFVGPAVKGEGFRVELGYLDQRLWREEAWSSVSVLSTTVFVTF